MKKAILTVSILFVAVFSTACINNFAVQELNNKAKTYLDQGNYDAAISRLQSSIDLDNTIFETHYNLGIACTNAERYAEAIEAFNNALSIKPETKDAYYSLAVAQENYARTMNLKKLKSVKNPDGTYKTEFVTKEEVISLLKNAMISYQKVLTLEPTEDDIALSKKQIETIKTDIEAIEQEIWTEPLPEEPTPANIVQ